jgi:hypothetical protein
VYPTQGAFLLPEHVAALPPPAGPVGIICSDPADAVRYLEAGPVGPYVIIRSAADVPAALGGMANLRTDVLEPELREAVTRALGVSSRR